MAMYSVSVTPLIASLQDSRVKQVWFADDATAGGTLHGLHDWWSRIQDLGSLYGEGSATIPNHVDGSRNHLE